jgi:hypothetical protein
VLARAAYRDDARIGIPRLGAVEQIVERGHRLPGLPAPADAPAGLSNSG